MIISRGPEKKLNLQSNLMLYQTIIWDRGTTANQNPSYFRWNLDKLFWLTKSSTSSISFFIGAEILSKSTIWLLF